ncbi:PRC-barrel domain-containing protein [Sphingosinicella sp. LY1275]|uniref:PRC-barrel domain-containing protein n=1 Tax=Sphingosinicella sp. LY1275 TaxID=3095379 RepID=UPI002ADEDB82|nr:PRC-barrel domain-containing protein [Sphingosinicella sp. LY1275]MEA1012972.1 PRC-barrel domain-containing protein [Sphingosinicella sp. LY1275]
MNIWERLDRDHIVIHAAAADIMQSHGDQPRRHNQFANYDHEVRRHLAVVEEVIFPLFRRDPATAATVAGLAAEHKALRRELRALDRTDKTADWIEDFNAFALRFEETCKQHDGLENLSRATIDEARAQTLGEEYEQAKIRHLDQETPDWRLVALGAGAALGAVAAGAAIVGAVRARSGGRDRAPLALHTDETVRLISSKKVEGTPVVNPAGERLGRIESFMVDKYSGRVAYAVLSFGGHMGFGRSLFPLPWDVLTYEETLGGYVLALTREELEAAPRFKASDEPEFSGEYLREIIVFYQPDRQPPADRGTRQNAGAPTPGMMEPA